MKSFVRALVVGSIAACASVALAAPPQGAPWTRFLIDNAYFGADGADVADANGNGYKDVVIAWEQSGLIRVYYNPGPEGVHSSWPSVTVGTSQGVEYAVFVDLDGDGMMDVVSVSEGITRDVKVHWAPTDPADLLNPAKWVTQSFPAAPASAWMFAAPAKLGGDGPIDVVIGSRQVDNPPMAGRLGWLRSPENPRDINAWTYHTIGSAGWTMSIIIEDMNGNGLDDVLISDRTGFFAGVRWYENPGPESPTLLFPWPRRTVYDGGFQTMFIATADLNGNGLRDIIVPRRNGTISWYERLDTSGQKWEQWQLALPSGVGLPKSVTIADVNNDGKKDIVASFVDAFVPLLGVVWFENTGNPYTPHWPTHNVSGPAGDKFDMVHLVDLDGDGDLDMITTEENTDNALYGLGLVWYRNPHITPGIPGDVNGDGLVNFEDLAVILAQFGMIGEALQGDLTGDGFVNFDDLAIVLSNFGVRRPDSEPPPLHGDPKSAPTRAESGNAH